MSPAPGNRNRGARISIRARVTAVAVLAVVVVSVVAGVVLVVSQRGVLVDQLDDGLEVDADRLAASVDDGLVPDLGDDDDRLVAIIVDGNVIASTDGLDRDALDALAAADDGTVSVDGDRYRAVRVDTDGRGSVVVAAPTEDVDEAIGALVRTLLVVLLLVTAVLGAIVWLLVGRTLRPVERIRAEVDTIGLDDLRRRVPEPDTGDEIARLAVTMNEMLGRLERSAERQRQFVADASHELRTPLARMRADLELGDDRLQGEPCQPLLHDVLALQRLVDDLLVLARNDADLRAPGRRIPVDLDDIVLAEAAAMGDVDTSHVSAAQVDGDAGALRRVVRNLLDNAARHAAATVTVALEEIDGAARLIVDDDGPGIPTEHREEVFERFRRLDGARTSSSGRSGLGLAIVRSVVEQHGGTVTIGDSPLGGARLTVDLPLPGATAIGA